MKFRTTAAESHRYTPEQPLAEWSDIVAAAERMRTSPFTILFASYARLVCDIAGSPEVVA